jgi:16S rRNA (adenine1518-N6/adenine1519-N6)-dimethyltransferase
MFTFQKELADRIISQPNNKSYSRLSVIVQSVCEIKKMQNLPSKVFYPIPKVSSTVLTFVRKKKIILNNFKSLEELTKLAFTKRRKSIKNSLKNVGNISYFLKELDIEDRLRPEQISVDQFCKLANLIYNFKE